MLAGLVVTLLVSAHVPTYRDGACAQNCCTPPRAHTTSQVIYLKGSGGLEVHLESDTVPFDTLAGELIDVDAVFRDAVDQSTYDLYIGCGGCVASEDPIVVPPLELDGYRPVEVEPFTQTHYRSALPARHRKFNASRLRDGVCDQGHFTIRLVDYGNRTDGAPIVWAPVVGLAERFSLAELLAFPVYILRNHGPVWNDLGYTYWLWLLVGAPLALRVAFAVSGRPRPRAAREYLYALAMLGFLSAALEEATHLVYVQVGHPVGYGLWVGAVLVVGLAQGAGFAFAWLLYATVRNPQWCISHPGWAPLEVATGLGLLLLLGSGFYVGPVAIVLAGAIRIGALARWLRPAPRAAAALPQTVEVRTAHANGTVGRTNSLGYLSASRA